MKAKLVFVLLLMATLSFADPMEIHMSYSLTQHGTLQNAYMTNMEIWMPSANDQYALVTDTNGNRILTFEFSSTVSGVHVVDSSLLLSSVISLGDATPYDIEIGEEGDMWISLGDDGIRYVEGPPTTTWGSLEELEYGIDVGDYISYGMDLIKPKNTSVPWHDRIYVANGSEGLSIVAYNTSLDYWYGAGHTTPAFFSNEDPYDVAACNRFSSGQLVDYIFVLTSENTVFACSNIGSVIIDDTYSLTGDYSRITARSVDNDPLEYEIFVSGSTSGIVHLLFHADEDATQPPYGELEYVETIAVNNYSVNASVMHEHPFTGLCDRYNGAAIFDFTDPEDYLSRDQAPSSLNIRDIEVYDPDEAPLNQDIYEWMYAVTPLTFIMVELNSAVSATAQPIIRGVCTDASTSSPVQGVDITYSHYLADDVEATSGATGWYALSLHVEDYFGLAVSPPAPYQGFMTNSVFVPAGYQRIDYALTTSAIDSGDRQSGIAVSPNPFNPTTSFTFTLPEASDVVVDVFAVTGQLVETLVDRQLSAGQHQYQFDGSHLSSGVYFIALNVDGAPVSTEKLVLLK